MYDFPANKDDGTRKKVFYLINNITCQSLLYYYENL